MVRVLLVAALLLFLPRVVVAQTLFGVSKNDNLLRSIDTDDASVIDSVEIALDSGDTISGATGLATHPDTGVLYAILIISGASDRSLASIDPENGDAEEIGDTGQLFASIAFNDTGELYGVTGDGDSPSETLFIIDIDDASVTEICSLGNGNDGETIGFNPEDGLLYHASGLSLPIFESIDDLDDEPCGTTDIDTSGLPVDDPEGMSMVFWEDEGVFLIQYGYDDHALYQIDADGSASLIGTTSIHYKGLAFAEIIDLGPEFLRGDVDGNGAVDGMRDAIVLLIYSFQSGPDPICLETADVDNDGEIIATLDALFLLNWHFALGATPEAPGITDCGPDPEGGDLGCLTEPECP